MVAALAEEFFTGDGARDVEPHGLRGRRHQAVDLQLPARRSARASWRCASISASAPRRPPTARRLALAQRRARHLLPLDRGGARRRSTPSSREAAARAGVALDGAAIRHAAQRARPGRAASSCGRRSSPIRAEPPTPWQPPVTQHRAREPPARLAAADRGADRATGSTAASGCRRAAGGSAPATSWCWCAGAARFVDGAGARAEAARRAGRRHRPHAPDRAARGRGSDGARPVPAAARRRPHARDACSRARSIGLDEETLFALAHGRGERSLWAELRAPRRQDLAVRRAVDELSALLARADFVAALRALRRRARRRGGGRRATAGAARPRGDRSARRVPGARPRLRARAMSRRCRASCTGSPPARPRSSATSTSAGATRSAS